MKIRTVTTGFNLKEPISARQIENVAAKTHRIKNAFEKHGFEVQTVRIVTQPWKGYYRSENQFLQLVCELENLCRKFRLDFFNVGTTRDTETIPILFNVIKQSQTGFCTVMVADKTGIDYEAARGAARLIKRVSRIQNDGFANLRFAAIFNTKPGSPFFPAAYHRGPTSFAIGTENSDLVVRAFSQALDLESGERRLKAEMTSAFRKIESIASRLESTERIRFGGIDVSIAPSVSRRHSLAYAFEKLGLGRFGESGTLAVARMITDTLKTIPVRQCGYSGLMLPVLEDYGLAKRNIQGAFDVTRLLLYSAVCGTGLDTIPLPGAISEKQVYALLLDIASLSLKLNKPLSARLMPIPGKQAGEMTSFAFTYFANTAIMRG